MGSEGSVGSPGSTGSTGKVRRCAPSIAEYKIRRCQKVRDAIKEIVSRITSCFPLRGEVPKAICASELDF